ncbi:MAG TPA: hypothetical protein VFI42_14805, partial [Thermomicrobiaceae bacterium]|nr:hypothetical protein [Thermomicrobiaceae bacterium]
MGTYTPFSPVSQSSVTGSGTNINPYRVTTVVAVGTTGITLSETDSYVVGSDSYQSDVALANEGSASQSVVIYRAGDCVLAGSDYGYGFLSNGTVGCSSNPNNSPAGRIEAWVPVTVGSHAGEGEYDDIWAAIATHAAFTDSCACTTELDNGAGLSWSLTIPAGQSL